MTIGTAIVVSIAIICGTFLAVMGIGAALAAKKANAAVNLTNEITNKLKHNLNK